MKRNFNDENVEYYGIKLNHKESIHNSIIQQIISCNEVISIKIIIILIIVTCFILY